MRGCLALENRFLAAKNKTENTSNINDLCVQSAFVRFFGLINTNNHAGGFVELLAGHWLIPNKRLQIGHLSNYNG